jgi:predicted porin
VKKTNIKYKASLASIIALFIAHSTVASADDAVKRLLELQLKKGIITQQEYDEFMEVTNSAVPQTPARVEVLTKSNKSTNAANAPASSDGTQGVSLIDNDSLKLEVFGTVDVSVGYTSQSLVPSGEMPTSIGPWISGGVKYPTTALIPGYPSSNMGSQAGLFNSALSTSSWGIKASRDLSEGKKAFIFLDSAFNPVTGQLIDQAHNESINSKYPTTAYATSSLNGQLFSKEAYVGLSDRETGRITFGRNNNFILDVMNGYAPLQKAGLFTPYGNGVYGGGGGISENARVDNSIKYTNKYGNINVGLMHGFGGSGGLKHGAEGTVGVIGYETDRYGVQLVYEEFKDLLKTSTDKTTLNAIDLTAYDQRALALVGKYKLNEKTWIQLGGQHAKMVNPTSDPNIAHITSIYGESVATGKSGSYSGDAVIVNTYHLGFDYAATEKLKLGAAYTFIELPKYDCSSCTTKNSLGGTNYLGGNISAISGLATYQLYKGTDLYGGFVSTHYSGDAFAKTTDYIFVHNIFTAATGVRFRF